MCSKFKKRRIRYKGWLILQTADDVFLCFTPDEAEYAMPGYEDWETDSIKAAKDWVDHYGKAC